MNIYCDDGSTNVKLAWFEGNELKTRVLLTPSGMVESGGIQCRNVQLSGGQAELHLGQRQQGCHPDNKRGISVR